MIETGRRETSERGEGVTGSFRASGTGSPRQAAQNHRKPRAFLPSPLSSCLSSRLPSLIALHWVMLNHKAPACIPDLEDVFSDFGVLTRRPWYRPNVVALPLWSSTVFSGRGLFPEVLPRCGVGEAGKNQPAVEKQHQAKACQMFHSLSSTSVS